jgi:hypothetical protein
MVPIVLQSRSQTGAANRTGARIGATRFSNSYLAGLMTALGREAGRCFLFKDLSIRFGGHIIEMRQHVNGGLQGTA